MYDKISSPVPVKLDSQPPWVVEHVRDSTTLEWKPVDKPGTKYIIEQRTLPDGEWQRVASDLDQPVHKVEGTKPDVDHEYRIRAENVYGVSEPTKPLYVKQIAGKGL